MAKSRLRFSKKILTPERKKRIALLVGVFLFSFIASVLLFNLRSDTIFSAREYSPTLPTITIVAQEEELARLYGYRHEMEYGRMKTSIIPLDEERTLGIKINTYGEEVSSIEYEISAMGGEVKISGEEVGDYNKAGDTISANLRLSTLVDPFRQYSFRVSLTSNEEKIHYYATILYTKGTGEYDCLEFAKGFRSTALSERYDSLALYMEPTVDINDSSLASVSINSSLNDVGWVGFGAKHASEPRAEFLEITPEYTALNLYYDVTRDTDKGEEHYEVTEYYRMRKGTERIYLLDFKRDMTQLLDTTSVSLRGADFIIGMNSDVISYKKNQTGTNIAFSWDGSLYSYNSITSTLSRVFHFGTGSSQQDERITHDEHDIYVRQIDENGNIDYVVYGYMNSGLHEGYSGVALYHYEHSENISTEQGFIALDYPYEAIKGSFNGAMHLIDRDRLYLVIENELICANLTDESVTTVCKAEGGSSFGLSSKGEYMAYSTPDAEGIEVTDLTSRSSFVIPAPEEKAVRVVGFMGEDLLYGVISRSDYNDVNRVDEIYPYEQIVITDPSAGAGSVIKEYGFHPNYITQASKQSDTLYLLEISARTDFGYNPVGRDSIQNTASLDDNQVELTTRRDGRLLYQSVRLNDSADKNTSIIHQNFDRSTNISYYETSKPIFADVNPGERFYAYRGRECLGSYGTLAKSIVCAREARGYCLDKNGDYIWQYGHGSAMKEISPEEVAGRPGNPGYRRYSLRGVDLSGVLSYVYQGNPVYINETGGNPMAITHFSENYITIYYMHTGEKRQMLINEATNAFNEQGNWYSIYLLNQN